MAAEAAPELRQLNHGQREQGFRVLAERFDVSPQTLRRAVAMLKFVERVESSQLMAGLNLRAVPLAGLEYIKKWNGYDAKGAAAAAKELVKGASVEAIAAGESEARARLSPTLRGRALAVGYRQYLAEYLSDILRLDEYISVKSKNNPWYSPSVDCCFIKQNDADFSLAAIAMGPYESDVAYRRMLNYWMVRSAGLSRLFSKVILAVPTEEIAQLGADWLKQNNMLDGSIEVMQVEI
ncbi:hypothetical protein IPV08_15115 [Methylobacterium sp. SD274]|uniref:hypothetical protein n=1 Tax=Methylobacterium sp. SD274 TaxID=2782009 RepID=UPI001A95D360|nr:hypothetical protein [Methylobacterium sp. SD274]MBO1021295.1 hypothetical protein [Methylobacterium sp. SD274]